MNTSLTLRRVPWLAAVLVVVACQRGPSPEVQSRIEQLTTAAEERDRLIGEMAETSRLLSEISGEISKVQVPGRAIRTSSESPLRAQRDTMLQKIRYISQRVVETEGRLRENRQRITQLTTVSDSLRNTLEQTVTNFEGIVATQLATIDALTEQVGTLQAERRALHDTLARVATRANTVYYLVATEDELLNKGILVKEGGSRFLFVLWKQGETLQPARELDPTAFTAIDRRETTQILLPDATAEYRIASRQNLFYLEVPREGNGAIRGGQALTIVDSERFWNPSRFLIVVKRGGRGGATAG